MTATDATSPSSPARSSATQRFGIVLRYALPHWRGWLIIISATLFSTLFSLLLPWPMKILIDHVIGSEPMPGTLRRLLDGIPYAGSPRAVVVYIALIGLLFYIVNSLLDVVLTTTWVRVGQRMVYQLAADLFARIQRRSLLFHVRNPIGDSMGRVMGDSWCVYKLVDTLLFSPGHALVLVIGMTVVLWRMSPSLTAVALPLAPLIAGAAVLFGGRVRAASRSRREIEAQIDAHVHRTLSGLPIVQAFVQEEREHSAFVRYTGAAVRAEQHNALIGSWSGLVSGLAATLGTSLILLLGARQVLQGRLSVGDLLVYLAYLRTLQTQFSSFAGTYTALQAARASVDRVAEVLDTEPEVRDRPGAVPLVGARGHVRIEDVTFGYEPDRPVLRGVSLEAQPGQFIAVVGSTGAGKSTLLGLLPRLFDPWQGRVLLDGHDVRDLTVASVRRHVAVVLQESFLFGASIRENIAFARPDASDDDIVEAAKAAGAHEFVERLPDGYETIIGERGSTLSGGERQRLSIARALLTEAPVVVLDEPTSGLDATTEQLVVRTIHRMLTHRTVLVIAHRLSTIRAADRIVVLEHGRVVETGTHEQLLRHAGVYANLYALQCGEVQPEAEVVEAR